MRPQVLVLDEPAAGLDPMGREEILGRIHAYQRKTKTAVVIVSHSMEDVGQYCDHLIVMNQGKIFCHGAPSEVFSHTEELQSVGLDVPQITQLICVLQKRGVPLPSDILTVDRAKEVLLPLLKK
jgi:energy-coupling factor transport system ATP-binding protein